MLKNYIKNFVVATVIASAGLLMSNSAKANLSLSCSSGAKYFSGESTPTSSQLYSVCGTTQIGSCVYQNNNGYCSGLLSSSYYCSSGFNAINYLGGNYAQASCFVIKTSTGCYVWNLGGQNVNQQVNCDLQYCNGKVEECWFYGTCNNPNPNPHGVGSVPEPTTFFAGLGLVIPMGIVAIRQFRKNRQSPETTI